MNWICGRAVGSSGSLNTSSLLGGGFKQFSFSPRKLGT